MLMSEHTAGLSKEIPRLGLKQTVRGEASQRKLMPETLCLLLLANGVDPDRPNALTIMYAIAPFTDFDAQ